MTEKTIPNPTVYPSLGQSTVVHLFQEMTTLISQEIGLAKLELSARASALASSSSQLVIGALLAYVALIALLLAAVVALTHFLTPALAAAVVGIVVILIGAVLIQRGYRTLSTLSLMPQKSVASLQADLAVVTNKASKNEMPVADGVDRAGSAKAQTKPKPEKVTVWYVLKTTIREWLDDEASLLAASLSYYSAVSLAPLLVLLVVVVGLFLSQATARQQLMTQLQGAIGEQGAQFLQLTLENADQPGLATIAGIVSFLTLLWGSTNVFSQLQSSLNKIWEVEPKPGRGIWGTLRDRLWSFSLVLGIAFLMLISFILSALLSMISTYGQSILPGADFLWQIVNFVVSLGVITLLFATIYKVLPDAHIAWRDVWIGAAATALLFTIGKTALGFYLANAGSSYGVAGSLIAFLLWVYYSAQILFFGAEFTQVYARTYGAGIQPAENAQSTNHS